MAEQTLFPAANSPQRQMKGETGRKKVELPRGRSLMDWIRLGEFIELFSD